MKTEEKRAALEEIVKKYPRRESAILPALYFVQKHNNNMLSEQDIKDVAEILDVSVSHTFGVATYYTMFNKKPVGRYHLQVDTNISAMLMGAEEIVAHLEKRLGIKVGETTADNMFTLSKVEDLGSGGTCPVVQVNDTYYELMTIEKIDALLESLQKDQMPPRQVNYNFGSECGILFKNRAKADAASITTYKSTGGYAALKKARSMQPQAVLEEVKDAEVRGRGGCLHRGHGPRPRGPAGGVRAVVAEIGPGDPDERPVRGLRRIGGGEPGARQNPEGGYRPRGPRRHRQPGNQNGGKTEN